MAVTEHPAKFSQPILDKIATLIDKYRIEGLAVDPFAGVGRVHELANPMLATIGVEIEAEWADQHPDTICGDSRGLVGLVGMADAIITSPAYGNRMADSYAGDAKGSTRHTYRIALGRPLDEHNGAGMQWGAGYRELHAAVWGQCRDVLCNGKRADGADGADGGWMIVNVSDHIRGGRRVPVVRWHIRELSGLGFRLVEASTVGTARQRHGRNGGLRVDGEQVLVFRHQLFLS